jgi:nitrate reductase beta subunit
MMYLPRLCEHCLNPACVASCPSGAIYKREEDGIVLIDQDKCRGWRMCVSGCPYKKIYYNWKSGKSEKCIFCYPRIEAGPADGVLGDLRRAHPLPRRACCTTPTASRKRPQCRREGPVPGPAGHLPRSERPGGDRPGAPTVSPIPGWRRRKRRSPVYKMAMEWKLALPLHPEYRTLPMVWYVPPLSPIQSAADAGKIGMNGAIPDVESLRIPVRYLANLLTAGDEAPVVRAMERMLAMRAYKRAKHVDGVEDLACSHQVG